MVRLTHTLTTTLVAPLSIMEILDSSALYLISSGSKRSLDTQGDTPEPKRRRTAGKRSRPASSETEASQSTSGPSAPFDEESELAALKKTLEQVQEDLSALQQAQRQVEDITRGVQHDRDEALPRDSLRFLEEHFTCALWVPLLRLQSSDYSTTHLWLTLTDVWR